MRVGLEVDYHSDLAISKCDKKNSGLSPGNRGSSRFGGWRLGMAPLTMIQE